MFKNIAIITSVLVVGGLLTWGAINRTQARASLNTGQRAGQIAAAQPDAGQGRRWTELVPVMPHEDGSSPADRPREGTGQQRSGGAGRDERVQAGGWRESAGDESATPTNWLMLTGTVAEIDGEHLTLRLPDGAEVVVEGRPWRFASESGFVPDLGDQLRISGFDEDGEFKAGALENLTRPQALTLRNADGQPAWRGAGR